MPVLAVSGPEPGAHGRSSLGTRLLWGLSWGVGGTSMPRGLFAWKSSVASQRGEGDCRVTEDRASHQEANRRLFFFLQGLMISQNPFILLWKDV